MKGKAQIILTDVRDGKQKIVHEENMFTNALDSLFNDDPYGLNSKSQFCQNIKTQGSNDTIFNALGGILCFPNELEEDVNHLYEPLNHQPTAYASNDAYTGDNIKRGSFNSVESGRITRGYKFVWDFTTSQGNGPISALALTNARAGISYFDNLTTVVKDGVFNPDGYAKAVGANGFNFNDNRLDGAWGILAHDDDSVLAMFYGFEGDSTVRNKLMRSYISPTKITIPDILDGSSYDNFMAGWHQVENPGLAIGAAYITEGENFYKVSSVTATSIVWTKYSIDLEVIGTGTWTLSGVSLKTGQGGIYTISNGYLYWPSSDNNHCYRINLSNLADVTELDHPNVSRMVDLGFAVMTSRGMLGEIGICNNTANIVMPYARTGVWLTTIARTGDGIYQSGGAANTLLTPYLATINNLQSPVIKDATKTMKIIYSVTEA